MTRPDSFVRDMLPEQAWAEGYCEGLWEAAMTLAQMARLEAEPLAKAALERACDEVGEQAGK